MALNKENGSLFQIVVVNFQLRAAGTNNRANVPPEPDLSAGRARGDFTLFAPAPTAVLFVILVFGTTRTFREYMWNLFVPRTLRDRFEERARARKRAQSSSAAAGSAPLGGSVSVVHSAMRDDVEAGNGNGVVLGLRDLGASQNGGGSAASPVGLGEGDKKSDEWPILKKGLGQMGRGR